MVAELKPVTAASLRSEARGAAADDYGFYSHCTAIENIGGRWCLLRLDRDGRRGGGETR